MSSLVLLSLPVPHCGYLCNLLSLAKSSPLLRSLQVTFPKISKISKSLVQKLRRLSVQRPGLKVTVQEEGKQNGKEVAVYDTKEVNYLERRLEKEFSFDKDLLTKG